ncbi:MAG: hypothetical protein VZQ99_11325, partial [Treponema sp.]|nr:hypothetical protein [Treponema sp.]
MYFFTSVCPVNRSVSNKKMREGAGRPAAALRRASPPFCLRNFIQLPAHAGWQSLCADDTIAAPLGRSRNWEHFLLLNS